MEANKLTGKKIIIFGAGIAGKKALSYFGTRNVKCFADNYKAGEFVRGKQVISFDALCKVYEDYDLVVALGRGPFYDVKRQLLTAGITQFFYFENLLSLSDFESDPKLRALKDTHKGEKCVIIGNGPSLQASDLDILKKNNCFSFGCNRIHKIFKQTSWRPNVYCIVDPYTLSSDMELILNLNGVDLKLLVHPRSTRFGEDYNPEISNLGQVLFFSAIFNPYEDYIHYDTDRQFSADPSRCIFALHSVVNVMIQWAAYMGFTDIFLLGVDNNYKSNQSNVIPNEDTDHFSSDYLDESYLAHIQAINYEPDKINLFMTKAYEIIEAYSREHDFRIYNATRGGKLEAFERVDFDSLFYLK